MQAVTVWESMVTVIPDHREPFASMMDEHLNFERPNDVFALGELDVVEHNAGLIEWLCIVDRFHVVLSGRLRLIDPSNERHPLSER